MKTDHKMSFRKRERAIFVKFALISSTFYRQDDLISAFPAQMTADKAEIHSLIQTINTSTGK